MRDLCYRAVCELGGRNLYKSFSMRAGRAVTLRVSMRCVTLFLRHLLLFRGAAGRLHHHSLDELRFRDRRVLHQDPGWLVGFGLEELAELARLGQIRGRGLDELGVGDREVVAADREGRGQTGGYRERDQGELGGEHVCSLLRARRSRRRKLKSSIQVHAASLTIRRNTQD